MNQKTGLVSNRIFSILTGVVAGVIVIYLFESLTNNIFPFPEGLDPKNKEDFDSFMSNLPPNAFILVLIGHSLGAFAGGYVSARMAKIQKRSATIFTSLILLVASILNIVSFHHPTWFIILDVIVYVPFGFLGYKIVQGIGSGKS